MTDSDIRKPGDPGTGPTDASQAPGSRFTRARQWVGRRHRRLYGRFPSMVPIPPLDDEASWIAEDIRENEGTRVPGDENLHVPIMWGMEMYGPAEIEGLYRSLRKLEWGEETHLRSQGPIRWLEEQRSYGWGGMYNLGHVVRRSDGGRHFPEPRYAPLPDEVDYIFVTIHQITSSLTCLLVGFRLRDVPARAYVRELNTDRATVKERVLRSRSIAILSPSDVKRRAVEKARQRLRSIVSGWFDNHAPGYFCGLDRPNRLPTAELIVSEQSPIFQEAVPSGHSRLDWRRLLAPSRPYSVWTSPECDSFQVAWLEAPEFDAGHHAVVAVRPTDIAAKVLSRRTSPNASADAYLTYCSNAISGLLVHQASDALLNETVRDLTITRETLRGIGARKARVIDTVDHIQRYFDRTIGTPAVASELAHRSSAKGSYMHDCPAFSARGWGDDPARIFPVELARRIHSLSSRLKGDELVVREHFEQLSSVLSIRESINAQRRMERLTIGALLVAFLSLLATLPTLAQWIQGR